MAKKKTIQADESKDLKQFEKDAENKVMTTESVLFDAFFINNNPKSFIETIAKHRNWDKMDIAENVPV